MSENQRGDHPTLLFLNDLSVTKYVCHHDENRELEVSQTSQEVFTTNINTGIMSFNFASNKKATCMKLVNV